MRLLGIDYGTKRVGIAVSDEAGRVAFPRDVLANDDHLLDHIAKLCAEEEIGAIVIGDSRNYAGEENPLMEAVHRFRTELEERTGLGVSYEQETLSTAQARRAPGKPEKTRKPAQEKALDAHAAAIILQSHLDKNSKF